MARHICGFCSHAASNHEHGPCETADGLCDCQQYVLKPTRQIEVAYRDQLQDYLNASEPVTID